MSSRVLAELARLWDQAIHHGEQVAQDRLAEQARVPPTTVNSWSIGKSLPRHLDQLTQVGSVLAGWARENPRPQAWWSRLLTADRADREACVEGPAPPDGGGGGAGVGWPLDEVTDPFALEVHRPIIAQRAETLPVLPRYVRRAHDQDLARVVERAAGGRSAMAVLVAGSSAGKTRACWEALRLLRDHPEEWRLWHPYDPTRPEAALQELDKAGPRTVVWLNETQEYLGGGEAGERVAARLRTLLIDGSRAPVLVLGTLWPGHHTELTRRPGSQVRQVLDGTIIEVPETFADTDPAALRQAAAADPRLAEAIEHTEDEQITQYLAGGPALLERLATAEPAAKAVLWAAMDARRLGHRNALPLPLLEKAAAAYLTDTQWDQLGEDWLDQALAYTAQPCKGARGPLTPIRSSHPHRRRGRRAPPASDHHGGPVYRLADYLDQHGRTHRAHQIPPIGFWSAATAHVRPADLRALGDAAWRRGLYRNSAQLHKNAAAQGDPSSARSLVDHLHQLHPANTDHRPASFTATHIALDDPRAVADLLGRLRDLGAHDQVTALVGRAAVHVALNNPSAVGFLLGRLRDVGAGDQVTALAGRAAAHVALNNPDAVADLLGRLRDVGAHDQVTALLARNPAAHATLTNPTGVWHLLYALRQAGAQDQVTALVSQVAAHVALDDQHAVDFLLGKLRQAGAQDQVTALVSRVAAHVALNNPLAVADLLGRLRDVGAGDQVTALAGRAAAHVALNNPSDVGFLLGRLRDVGAGDQVTALLARNPAAHATLNNPSAVGFLLGRLRDVGAGDQVTALASRAAAHVALNNPSDVGFLLGRLRDLGAHDQVTALAGRAAAHVALDDPRAVADLLGRLRDVGGQNEVTALASRAAAHVALDDPRAVAGLLGRLRDVGAGDQVTALASRLPAAGMFGRFLMVDDHAVRYWFGREPDGSAANPWGWEDLE